MSIRVICQRILEEQGFISVLCDRHYAPGTIWEDIQTIGGEKVDGPIVVLGPSSREEYKKQADVYELEGSSEAMADVELTHFLRVAAE